MMRGRRKVPRGGKRTTARAPASIDAPSDSPKRKDSKMEFQGRLSHASPRVTDSRITQFFHPENGGESPSKNLAVTATIVARSVSPCSIIPAHEEITVIDVITRPIMMEMPKTEEKERFPANGIAACKACPSPPEVIVLSDDERDNDPVNDAPKTITPHKMILEPAMPAMLSPSSALSQLNLANGAAKKAVKSRRRLNPSQAVNQLAPPQTVSKLGCYNKPKAPSSTNTATKATNERADPSHKLTEYFPVRRSERKTKKTVLEERQRSIEEAVLSGREEGLEIHNFEGKGRGVVATRCFQKGEFVVEYAGELIKIDEARDREKMYAQDQNTGCYMYYFKHRNDQYCVDATAETDRLGRLVNHSRNGNLMTKTIVLNNNPRLVLVAKEDITPGEEVTYDYGDRSKESLRYHPWLAN